MKKKIVFLISFMICAYIIQPAVTARFMKKPDVCKNSIVFTYENDLWLLNLKTMKTERITSFPGIETDAKFSPDMKYIAFTGTYNSGSNVYLMSVENGKIKRLTWNPQGGTMVEWTPDSKRVVFKSFWKVTVSRDPVLYSCDLTGSLPEKLPPDRGVNCSFNDSGSLLFYARKGREEYQWKRYRGGHNVDLWMYDYKSKQFSPLSTFKGKNAYPMYAGGNKLIYVSDKSGISNLSLMDLNTKESTQLTNYKDFDVRYASIGKENIVFVQNGYLNLFNLKEKKVRKLDIKVNSDRWRKMPLTVNPSKYIHYALPSDSGKNFIFEARGDIFLIDSGSFSLNLTESPGSREMYPAISPDEKNIAFFSDKSGEYQLCIQNLRSMETTTLTTELKTLNYEVLWSPDSSKLLFSDKTYTMYLYDLKKKKLKKIKEQRPQQVKNDEFYWKMSDYSWSPDSRWITYSLVAENKNSVIFLYSTETGKHISVTDDFFDNLNPVFSKNGKYLFYLSSRNFDIKMDFYEDNHIVANPQKIVCVELQKKNKKPFIHSEKSKKMRVDLKNLSQRQRILKIKPGNYFHLKSAEGYLIWNSVKDFTEDEYEEIFEPKGKTKWTCHIYNIKTGKEKKVKQKIADLKISVNGRNCLVKSGGKFYPVKASSLFTSAELSLPLSLKNMKYKINHEKEWTQIFSDVWRWYRDFFYDTGMHGQNWEEIRLKYRAMIKDLSGRSELNEMLSQMVGELCVGHAYIGGGDRDFVSTPVYSEFFPVSLGIEVEKNRSKFYRITKVLKPSKYNLSVYAPLFNKTVRAEPGMYLIAVNRKKVSSDRNLFEYLQFSNTSEIEVTLNSKPSFTGAQTYRIKPLKSERKLRYFSWLTSNIEKVKNLSNGEFGYMHINAMGSGGIAEFDKFWRAFRYKKGIIIDVRRNGGGWTEYFMIDKLERKLTARNNLRKGTRSFKYPGSASDAKYVLISNEHNGSDGEAFTEHFKARFSENKRGKVIGMPSWGGLVGIINMQKTIDNGYVYQPNNGFYGKEGKWWVENRGATPDILVDNDPKSASEGRDKQLERAVLELRKMLKEKPQKKFPERPEYPVR